MSYNGSGTFNINTSGQPVVTGTVISSTAFNALTADLATGLSTAITKDGQTATTARIPFAAGISSTLVTDSTSISTGSIITAGGVGVAKALFVGTTANIAGVLSTTSPNITTSITTPSTSFDLINATATTLNLGGAATAVNVGAATGTMTVANTTLAAKAITASTTLSVTGVTTVQAGTAALPAITTTGDTNTGIFFPAADQVAITTGGTQRAVVDASGNVGIGTSSPTAKLHVYAAAGDINGQIQTAGAGQASLNLYNSTRQFRLIADASANALVIYDQTASAERARIDSSGNLLVTNAAGLGYGTGAGGTVTQATNKGTAVTLNKPTGQVTTNNAALGAGATVSFSINNSIITATDNIMVVVTGGSSYTVQPAFVSGGVANIRLTNITGGSLSEAVVINFAVIKGATS